MCASSETHSHAYQCATHNISAIAASLWVSLLIVKHGFLFVNLYLSTIDTADHLTNKRFGSWDTYKELVPRSACYRQGSEAINPRPDTWHPPESMLNTSPLPGYNEFHAWSDPYWYAFDFFISIRRNPLQGVFMVLLSRAMYLVNVMIAEPGLYQHCYAVTVICRAPDGGSVQ